MLALLGLSTVGILAGNNPLRGIAAGLLGLLLGSIGSAPAVPEYRYTFDILYLSNGIPLSVLALALICFTRNGRSLIWEAKYCFYPKCGG